MKPVPVIVTAVPAAPDAGEKPVMLGAGGTRTIKADEDEPVPRLLDTEMVPLDAEAGTLEVLVPAGDFALRRTADADLIGNEFGFGRELFAGFRQLVGRADHGASAFGTA